MNPCVVLLDCKQGVWPKQNNRENICKNRNPLEGKNGYVSKNGTHEQSGTFKCCEEL